MPRTKTSGQGRPAGTPNRITRPIRELAANFSEGAIKVLVQLMIDPTAPHAARIAAAREILARAHGRPAAAVKVALPKNATLAQTGEAVLTAATSGEMGVETASQLLSALAAQASLIEKSELLQRLEALESTLNQSGNIA